MINMNGLDWAKGPEGGIYLMAGDTSKSQVQRAAGKRLTGKQKLRGWDGGRFIPGDVKTTADAVEACGLDWLVERHPIVKVTPVMGVGDDGVPTIIGWEPRKSDTAPVSRPGAQANTMPTGGWDIVPDKTLNVRNDTGDVLGVVGPSWTGPQNHEAFQFVDDLVDNGDAKWLGGGESKGGTRVWMCAQLDKQAVIGGDANEMSVPLCYLTNGWDGLTSLAITVAPYRLACLNGQTIPLEGHVRTWRVRHTANHADRLMVARQALELSVGYFDEWAVAMERLMTVKVAQRTIDKHIRVLFPDPKPKKDADGKMTVTKTAQANVDAKRLTLLDIYRDTDNLQHLGNTGYRFFNAVTEYADWHVKAPAETQVLRTAEPSMIKDTAYALLTA
jgi:phage/plasmid-like protein (TIGR03299 family)